MSLNGLIFSILSAGSLEIPYGAAVPKASSLTGWNVKPALTLLTRNQKSPERYVVGI